MLYDNAIHRGRTIRAWLVEADIDDDVADDTASSAFSNAPESKYESIELISARLVASL